MWSHPLGSHSLVVCKNQLELELLEPSPLLDSSSLDRTPLYEGVGGSQLRQLQVVVKL